METRVIMGCCIFVAVFSPFLLQALSSLEIRLLDFLTLSRVAPSAVSKGWGGLIGPPHVSKGVGVVLVSNFSCNLRSDHD